MSASIGYFVTGSDTEISNTLVSCTLLHALARVGVRAAAMNPSLRGGLRDGVWHNENVDLLAAAAPVVLPSDLTTPYLPRDAVVIEGVGGTFVFPCRISRMPLISRSSLACRSCSWSACGSGASSMRC